ncbi:MAG: Uncharacterized protein JWR02_3021 [Mucilaginibacter sp.]|nr:Uncharacterized protein [Mucilaginibacter sp.]
MKNTLSYLTFIKEKGRPVLERHPGSNEVALTVVDALEYLELLKKSNMLILGGDIYSEENGELILAIQAWGYNYHFLSWYCEKKEKETDEELIERSYNFAKQSILRANEIANQIKKSCFIVFVI